MSGKRSRRSVDLEHAFETAALLERQALLVSVLHLAMAGAVTVHMLLTKRDVPAAIGWIGMAWLAPVLGSLLYVGFGISRVRRRAQRLKGSGRAIDPPPRASVFGGADRAAEDCDREDHRPGDGDGKVVSVLECGDQGYPQMLAAIDGARSEIRLSHIHLPHRRRRPAIHQALVRAHRRGVKTRVLIDGFGGGFLRSSTIRLAQARRSRGPLPPFDAAVEDAVPRLAVAQEKPGRRRGRRFRRGPQHRRRERHGEAAENAGAGHSFPLAGAIVRQIEQEFDDDWAFTTGEQMVAAGPCALRAGRRRIGGARDRRRARPGGRSAGSRLLSAVNFARRSIRVATPYFLPDEQLITALQLAALRGVDVRSSCRRAKIICWSPGRSRTHIRPLLQSGMSGSGEAAPPFDHSKLMTDRRQMEPHRQRQLGHAQPPPEFRIDC